MSIEFICIQCKGSGEERQEINFTLKITICRMCKGTGKVDWIQHVLGRLEEPKEKEIKVSDKRRIR